MARRRRPTVKPVLSAFIWGVLTMIGISPGKMIFETAVEEFGPYLQFATLVILVILVYFSIDWIVEGLKRTRRAFRTAGVAGVAAIILAFAAGLLVFEGGSSAVFALLVAMVLWLYATWR